MVFRGRLRFADPQGPARAMERLARFGGLEGSLRVDGPTLVVDANLVADATDYPEILTTFDEIADEAFGGSIIARLGGQPSDHVGAAAPVEGIDHLSHDAQELLRAVLGGDREAVEAGRHDVLASDELLDELIAGWPVLDEPEQRALFVVLVGARLDARLAPMMRAALELPPGVEGGGERGDELFDIARHLALCHFAGTHELPYDWSDRERVAAEIARVRA